MTRLYGNKFSLAAAQKDQLMGPQVETKRNEMNGTKRDGTERNETK